MMGITCLKRSLGFPWFLLYRALGALIELTRAIPEGLISKGLAEPEKEIRAGTGREEENLQGKVRPEVEAG